MKKIETVFSKLGPAPPSRIKTTIEAAAAAARQ